jgi:AcrR family transcriptional regulator
MTASGPSLQEKRATATRDHILGAAFELLVEHPERPFSHEAVAEAAGVGARTVYRYFPAQADLFEALWLQVREQSGTVFPTAEAEIVPKIGALFRAFDQNEKLLRAVMESPAGARVRARGAEEGRTSFDQSLKDVTQGLGATECRQVRALFLGIHSGPFWQMLHERGGLSGPEAIAAASWAAQALLDALRREKKNSCSKSDDTKKKGDRPK